MLSGNLAPGRQGLNHPPLTSSGVCEPSPLQREGPAHAHHQRVLQGNWGNALLAYGSLKKKVLTGVSRAAAAGPAEQQAIAASQAQITQEASAALIAAGRLDHKPTLYRQGTKSN